MFIAGVPAEVGAHALNHWHLRNATSFNGCVKELHINGKLVDFLQGSYGAKRLDEHAIFNYCTPFFMGKIDHITGGDYEAQGVARLRRLRGRERG